MKSKKVSDTNKMILAVDLDGTLINTDILYESFWSSLSRDWKTIIVLFTTLLKGKLFLKNSLKNTSKIDITKLPYNYDVIKYIKQMRSKGFQVVLITASHQFFADEISNHLNLFDYSFGSNKFVNLKGKNKAKFLIEKFGNKGFDYIGNSISDLEVWKVSKKAITCNASNSLKLKLEKINLNYKHLNTIKINLSEYCRSIRPQQWIKNVLIFLPILASHQLEFITISKSLVGFLAISLMASSIYLANDLLDLSDDRIHKVKKNRPFASGTIPILNGSILMLILFLLSLTISISLGWQFLLIIFSYFIIANTYSLFLKKIIILDMCILAGFYTLRVVAGGIATNIEISIWLIAFSIFIFFSLASVKRQAELVGSKSMKNKINIRRGYTKQDLTLITQMGIVSGYISVIVMALYIDSLKVQFLYSSPNFLWGVCFVIFFWISRIIIITHKGLMHHDPVAYATRDKVSIICLILISLFVLAGKFL